MRLEVELRIFGHLASADISAEVKVLLGENGTQENSLQVSR